MRSLDNNGASFSNSKGNTAKFISMFSIFKILKKKLLKKKIKGKNKCSKNCHQLSKLNVNTKYARKKMEAIEKIENKEKLRKI